MGDPRRDPNRILKEIEKEEARKGRGHLHIFFGYAAGVGKTYAMLKAAHTTVKNGYDTVVGYVEPHTRPETTALLEGLEVLPTKTCVERSITVQEFDLDAALERKPQLILVDELAHTNAPGCRHEKRYQDVEELLAAGIDVYTTVNVQHIESLNDMVASITGVYVRERVPDKIFDDADQVSIVDIEPEELLERLKQGKIYREAQAQQATANFFTVENLTALREIALRRCADRVNLLSDEARAKSGSDYYTDEHILVCLSPSPSNAKIIRNASRMAKAFHGNFTALFVETSKYQSMSEEDKKHLRDNIHLAEQLGATVETTYGDDVAMQIAEFARLSGVSKIVVGRSSVRRRAFFKKRSMTEQLIAYAPNLDVYVIPDQAAESYRQRRQFEVQESGKQLVYDSLKTIALLIGATAIGFLFFDLGLGEANIIMTYILAVLITAVVTAGRGFSIISSIVSVLAFNFCFTEPRFTFYIYDQSYIVTFFIMLLTAIIASYLTVKIKKSAKQSASAAYRTKILLDTNSMLLKDKSKQEIVDTLANQLIKLLQRDVVFYLEENGTLSNAMPYSHDDGQVPKECYSEKERQVALWTFKNNKHAGATTATLNSSKCLYLAIRVNEKVYGVVGISMDERGLDAFENSILLSILGGGALALENEQAAIDREEAAKQAKDEKLSAHLLRAMSHDVRAPLTAISENADALIQNSEVMPEENKEMVYNEIHDDSSWLMNLIDNVVSVTQIEDGTMHMQITEENLDDILDEALKHTIRQSKEHNISVVHAKERLDVKVDARLVKQATINIVDNAIKYTAAGSEIVVRSFRRGNNAVVTISDNGPGIPDDAKPHIFDMFYTGSKVVEAKRSLGLGLPLSKYIIDALGGAVSVEDNHPNGTVLIFSLPLAAQKYIEQAPHPAKYAQSA